MQNNMVIEHFINKVIDIGQLKTYLRIDHNEDDDMLLMIVESSIAEAERYISKHIGLKKMTYTKQITLSDQNNDHEMYEIKLPERPVYSIERVTIDGEPDELPEEAYSCIYDDGVSYAYIKKSQLKAPEDVIQTVTIEYLVGCEPVPKDLQLAIYMMCADTYRAELRYTMDIKRILSRYKAKDVI